MFINRFEDFLFEREKMNVPYTFEDFKNIIKSDNMYAEIQKLVDWYVKAYGQTENVGSAIMYTFFLDYWIIVSQMKNWNNFIMQ